MLPTRTNAIQSDKKSGPKKTMLQQIEEFETNESLQRNMKTRRPCGLFLALQIAMFHTKLGSLDWNPSAGYACIRCAAAVKDVLQHLLLQSTAGKEASTAKPQGSSCGASVKFGSVSVDRMPTPRVHPCVGEAGPDSGPETGAQDLPENQPVLSPPKGHQDATRKSSCRGSASSRGNESRISPSTEPLSRIRVPEAHPEARLFEDRPLEDQLS